MTLDALQLALDQPGHDDAPAVVQEAPRDRGAEAAGAAGDDRGAGHCVRSCPRGSTAREMRPNPMPIVTDPSALAPTVSAVLVRDLTDGMEIDQVLLVRAAEVRTKADGAPYLRLTLGDRTGAAVAMVWDDVPRLRDVCTQGTPLHVRAGYERHPKYGPQFRLRGLGPAAARHLRSRRPARRPAAPGGGDGGATCASSSRRSRTRTCARCWTASSARRRRRGRSTAARPRPSTTTRPTSTACSSTPCRSRRRSAPRARPSRASTATSR